MSENAKHEAIMATLTEVFRDVFDDDEIVLRETTSAHDIPEWDSLNHITLCVAVEKRCNVRLNASEIAKLSNVGELAELLARKTS